LADDLSAAQNRLRDNWRPPKGTGKHTRATRAPGLVRSVHRRREDLDAHLVDVPPPPRRFTMPDLPARPGATLLRADGVAVPDRLRRTDLAVSSGDRLVVTGPNGAGNTTWNL
ncbi:MAG: ABC transporter ATP-binding protein, partial [Microbacterium sp.]|nr:ABC transporter ATP-binding protein [Microbacterium sp.]